MLKNLVFRAIRYNVQSKTGHINMPNLIGLLVRYRVSFINGIEMMYLEGISGVISDHEMERKKKKNLNTSNAEEEFELPPNVPELIVHELTEIGRGKEFSPSQMKGYLRARGTRILSSLKPEVRERALELVCSVLENKA